MPMINAAGGPVAYLDEGDGPPIVLLHGIQGTARTWDRVAQALVPHYRVVRPDLRGRGQSHTPAGAGAYRMPDFADDLDATLAMIGRPAVVVAWSMAVSVTLELLLGRCPATLPRALVLVSGTPFVGTEARWFAGSSADEVAQEAQARAIALALSESAAPHAVAASWQQVQQADYRARLNAITLPTLVVHGVDDDQCPLSHGRLMAQTIPGARMVEWDATGHNPMARDPARFAAAIDAFVASLPPPVSH
ncbi:MAG TPA: alpha/beta fold hydrolase [Telluria sp.]